MDAKQVRERLLFLNKEMHDERFKNMNLSGVDAMWGQAKSLYEAGRLEEAERFIDGALAALYGGRVQQQSVRQQVPQMQVPQQQVPQMQVPQQQVPQMQVPQPQVIPLVPVYYMAPESDDSGVMKLLSFISGSFLEICWYMLTKPAKVFNFIRHRCPYPDVLIVYAAFGLFSILAAVFSFEMGLLDNLRALVLSPPAGILVGALASLILWATTRMVGYKTNVVQLFCVYGFSLIPSVLIGVIILAAYLMAPGFMYSGFNADLFSAVVSVPLLLWTLSLQVMGMDLVCGIPRPKSIIAIMSANFAVMALLLVAGGAYIGPAMASV